jgi:hypothetical protein
MPITFNMVIKAEGIDPRDVHLARHHDTRPECKITPYELWRRDLRDNTTLLEEYQNIQSTAQFPIGKLLASFVRTRDGKTLFVGLFAVNSKGVTDEGVIDPCSGLPRPGLIHYDMSRDDRLKDMQGRLVVDWGKGYIAWHQLAGRNDKRVIEILPDREDDAQFPGSFHFKWKLSEIAYIPSAWQSRLSEMKGVYVLTSIANRDHYVGSATGKGGFFERWMGHAKVGGDAVGFKARAPGDYQVSILEVASGFETADDIVRRENAWMEKLQSRGMGINGQPPTLVTVDISVSPQPDGIPAAS